MPAFGLGMVWGDPDIQAEVTHLLKTYVALKSVDLILNVSVRGHDRGVAV